MDQESFASPDPDPFRFGVVVSPPAAYRPRWWLHATLLVATLVTTTLAGALTFGWLPQGLVERIATATGFLSLLPEPVLFVAIATQRAGAMAILDNAVLLVESIGDPRYLAEGLKFSLPLLTILMSHEMGHYIACRRHRLLATPPFFLPFPIGIGTLGAVIRIKEPIRFRRQLLDVGAAGPIAGFLVLLPFLAAGLALADVSTVEPGAPYYVFGEPPAFHLLERVMLGNDVADASLRLHPMGWAAWCGLLVTLLNLLPFAQLDGGHITYALLGKLQRRAAWPLLGVLVVLGFFWPGWWLWTFIVLLLRVEHPPAWDEEQPLDLRRKLVAWIALLIFALCFMLEPIRYVPEPLPTPEAAPAAAPVSSEAT